MALEGAVREAWRNGGAFHDKQVWALLRSEHLERAGQRRTPAAQAVRAPVEEPLEPLPLGRSRS